MVHPILKGCSICWSFRLKSPIKHTKMVTSGKESIKFCLFLLRLCGLWPDGSGLWSKLYYFYSAIIFSFICVGFPLAALVYISKVKVTILEFVDTEYLLPEFVAIAFKLSVLFLKTRDVKCIVNTLFQPSMNKQKPEQDVFIQEAGSKMKLNNMVFIIFVLCECVSWVTVPLLSKPLKMLPIPIILPFDPLEDAYVGVYIYEAICKF